MAKSRDGTAPTAAELAAMIEQVYAMTSWHSGDEVDYPPAADGRWVIMQGGIVSTLIKTNKDGSKSIVALYGHYEIEDGIFRYGYDGGEALVQRPGQSAPLPIPVTFGDTKDYAATWDGDNIRLRHPDGAGLYLTPTGIEYYENDVLHRRWHRIRKS